MQIPGYWVSGFGENVTVEPTVFDDTELSEPSEWREAWENDDPAAAHGFVERSAAIEDALRRRRIGPDAKSEDL